MQTPRAFLLAALLAAPLAAQEPQYFYIPDSDATVGTCNTIPLGWGSPVSYQTRVPAAELAAGYITSLAFAPCSTGTSTYVNLRITMAHSSAGLLSTTFANNLQSPPGGYEVLNRTSVDWIHTADTWSNIPLDRHFAYNGTDDLIIEVRCDADINGTACHRDVRERLFNTSSSSATTGTLGNAALKMRIGFGEYAYSDSNDPTTGTCNVFPFGQAQMRYQQLVEAQDLPNHPGIIRDIAFTPCGTGSTTYTSLQVTLAHTSVTSLSTANTFDSNLQNPALGQVVLAGSVTYNYTSGEWSNLGLTSGFNYDGVSNLIIDVQAVGGTQSFHRDATRWRSWNSNIAATNPSNSAATALKVRLTIECPVAQRAISPFNEGCGPNINGPLGIGTGTPGTGGAGYPVLGGTHELLMRFGPASGLGAFVLGFNNGSPYPQPLPGAPGCFQRVDNIGVLITTFQATGFSVPVPFALTGDPVWCGLTYYVQGAALWPGANALGVITSNVLTMTIGN
ncbi:MAG: hypothetical protein U1E73_11110 [Planctomycetota bacterium]